MPLSADELWKKAKIIDQRGHWEMEGISEEDEDTIWEIVEAIRESRANRRAVGGPVQVSTTSRHPDQVQTGRGKRGGAKKTKKRLRKKKKYNKSKNTKIKKVKKRGKN